ncbi:MAG: SRPBCC domain-containing protein [Ilumatobacteraceae bacterium]
MTATFHPDTEILADPKVPLIRIVRAFDATPAKVFRAHADPELYARWCGPRSLTTFIDTWDFRNGGSWVFHQERGEDRFDFYGCFHEVRPDQLIVQTFTFRRVPRRRRPRTARVRGARRRTLPARGHIVGRQLRRARRDDRERHGVRDPRGLREAGRTARPLSCRPTGRPADRPGSGVG